MGMEVGADLWHMNNFAGPSMALGAGVSGDVLDGAAAQPRTCGRHDCRRT